MRRFLVCFFSICLAISGFAQVVGRVTEHPDGSEFHHLASTPVISQDGRAVIFRGSDAGLWRKDLGTGSLQRIASLPTSDTPWSLSSDRRHLVFSSTDETLVPNKRNRCWRTGSAGRGIVTSFTSCSDIFVRDLATGVTTRLWGPEGGEIAAWSTVAAFSTDDRWIVYSRSLADRVQPQPQELLLHDRQSGRTAVVAPLCGSATWSTSDDASRVVFASTCAGSSDSPLGVYLYERASGRVENVHPLETSWPANPQISGDGRFVAFEVRCLIAECPPIGTPHVYVRDLDRRRTWNLARGPDGRPPNSGVEVRDISHDGRFVLVESLGQLDASDRSGFVDVYVVDRITGANTRVSVGDGGKSNGRSNAFVGSMSADGMRIVFGTFATNLLPGRPTTRGHVYLASLDSDGDGMNDAWERFVGLSPADSGDASQDPDGDGLSNLEEFQRGSHPSGRYRFRTRAPDADPEASRIRLRSASSTTALVWLRLVDSAGRSSSYPVRIPSRETVHIPITDIPDRPREPFMLHVESDEPIFPGLAQPR